MMILKIATNTGPEAHNDFAVIESGSIMIFSPTITAYLHQLFTLLVQHPYAKQNVSVNTRIQLDIFDFAQNLGFKLQ